MKRVGLIVVVAVLVCCSAAGARVAPKRGGIYRVGVDTSFLLTDDFDPTGETGGVAQGILSNLVVRTLVGFDHIAGPAGSKVVPDLATSVPAPTDGGRTYTFHLKPAVKFGPPVNREITSQDELYALERLANPKDGGELAFAFRPVVGWDAYAAGKAKTITGIVTPNASTIVFHLTEPSADFLVWLASPMAGPIPDEVAGCFEGKPGEYGRDLVSTGPYMFEGADKVDDSSCAKLKPMSGFDGLTSLTLVRNPDYNPATDSKAARENLPDEFRFTVDSSIDDIAQHVEAGDLDDELTSALPPQVLERYANDTKLRPLLKIDPTLNTFYISMNLTQPPFDDIHVRRALSWVLDKAALRQSIGGPLVGAIATHIAANVLFGNQLRGYDPYRTPGSHGSLARAKAAMKGSRYDTEENGTCSAAACKHVLLLAATTAADPGLIAALQQDAAKIGITFTVRAVDGPFSIAQTVARNIPIEEFSGYGSGPDPASMFRPLFSGQTIIPLGNTDWTLVGITPAQCRADHVRGDCSPYDAETGVGVPSVDALIDRCGRLAGAARRSCYEHLDEQLMTRVVPVVPWCWLDAQHLIGSDVSKWGYDISSGTTAFAHVAVS